MGVNPAILCFEGENEIYSNFYPYPIVYRGISYPTSEAAFQAAKTHSGKDKLWIASLSSPGRAKRAGSRRGLNGRTIELRPDWEEVKDGIMLEISRIKYKKGTGLADRLVRTYPAVLEEGNAHGDVYWGKVNGVGRNQLGKTLMQVRNELMP